MPPTTTTTQRKQDKERGVTDVWSQLINNSKANQDSYKKAREPNFVFVGSKASGKSTLIKLFIMKEKVEEPKPSACLDYKYTRMTPPNSSDKLVSHIWELGGGRSMSSAISLPLKPETLQHTIVILVLDLSKPSLIPDEIEFWTKTLKSTIETSMKASGDAPTSSDDRLNTLSTVPLLFVANKFELFQDRDAECLKVMARTLRCLALAHGAGLLYTSNSLKQQQQAFRMWLNRHMLAKSAGKATAVDHTQPLVVPAGVDKLESIGLPQNSRSQDPVLAWLEHFKTVFKQTEEERASIEKTKIKIDFNKLDSEPLVDEAWRQKCDNLLRMKKEIKLQQS